jgi:hypothetical protein
MSFNTILSATKISASLDLDIGFFPSIASLSNGSFAVLRRNGQVDSGLVAPSSANASCEASQNAARYFLG